MFQRTNKYILEEGKERDGECDVNIYTMWVLCIHAEYQSMQIQDGEEKIIFTKRLQS